METVHIKIIKKFIIKCDFTAEKCFPSNAETKREQKVFRSLLLSSIDWGCFSSLHVIKRHQTNERNNEKRLNLVMSFFGETLTSEIVQRGTKDFLVSRYWQTLSRRFKTLKPSKKLIFVLVLVPACWRNSRVKGKDRKAFKCQICFASNMPIIVKMFQMCSTNRKKRITCRCLLWNKQISCINATILKTAENDD